MNAYVAGDRRAFERLYALLAPRVHGFFCRTFGERALADDLLQTTFLKLHRARAEYRPEARLRPWLFTIAARVRLDELRKQKRLAEDGDEDTLARADEARSIAAPFAPDVDGADRDARVRAALDRLPESQRVVVHLHRYEQLTMDEIAKTLGSTEGAIKLRAFRAYETLRKELSGLWAEERVA